MPALTQEIAFISSGVVELESYLISKDLYWQITSGTHFQCLTIGNLLLCIKRVRPRMKNIPDRTMVASFQDVLDIVHSKWPIAWEKKCQREAKARIDLFLNYLEDYHRSPQIEACHYTYQVRSRVILDLLQVDTPSLLNDLQVLPELDKMIHSAWISGDFTWESYIEDEFPREKFWYLFGRLKS